MFLSQDDYNCRKNSFMPSGHFVSDKYTFNGLPFNDVLATVLVTVESPISWRINNEKSYKNRLYG